MTDTPPARITVARRQPHDVKIRQVIVSIDGETVATLLYGDGVTREVEPGPHRVRVHNTLVWKTKEIDTRPGDHVTFTVTNRAGWGTFWMVALLGAGPLFLDFDRAE